MAEGQKSYMDLLITTLMEHEKNLDALADKLERIVNNPLLTALAELKVKATAQILKGQYEGVEILANEKEFILMWNPPKGTLPIRIKTEHLITMLRALELL